MTASRCVLVDADVGIDDAIAIVYLAARPDTRIVGIGSVHGNTSSEHATENALYVLEVCGLTETPVAAGAATPLEQPLQHAAHVHGGDGLGDLGLRPRRMSRSGETAADQIIRISNELAGEVDLLAIGPLTNLASAIQRDETVLTRFRSVAIMGGGGCFPAPGVLLAPDNNTSFDTRAAEIVYSAPRNEMIMVGANVCSPTVLDEPAIRRIEVADTPQARLVSQLLPCYLQAYQRRYGRSVCPVYDALAAGILVDRSYATDLRRGPVNIVDDGDRPRAWLMEREDRGPLVLDIEPAPETLAVMSVDGDRFVDDLVEAIVSRPG